MGQSNASGLRLVANIERKSSWQVFPLHVGSGLVIALVEQKKSEIADLCRRYRVERLALFGSAVAGRFQPDSSDLDFLVRFADREPTGSYADRYLGLADSLERLFERRVDLVTEESIRNPYFRREVEATRRPLYEQPREEAAV